MPLEVWGDIPEISTAQLGSAPPRAGTSFRNPETNHFAFSEIQIVLVFQSRTGFPIFFFKFEN